MSCRFIDKNGLIFEDKNTRPFVFSGDDCEPPIDPCETLSMLMCKRFLYKRVLDYKSEPILDECGNFVMEWQLDEQPLDLLKLEAGTLLEIRGLDFYESTYVESQSAFTPGTTVNKIIDTKRQIQMLFEVDRCTRETIVHYFQNNAKIRLYGNRGRGERYIDCIVKSADSDAYRACSDSQVIINLQCNYPYWLDVDDFGESLAEEIGIKGPVLGYMPAKYYGVPVYDKNYNIKLISASYYPYAVGQYSTTNSGDVPVGFYFRITSTAPVTNPYVKLKSTGQFIKVGNNMKPFVLNKGDVLEISTLDTKGPIIDMDERIYVKYNGTNYNMWVDKYSTPNMKIPPGEHYMIYGADSNESAMKPYFHRQWGRAFL